MERHKKHIEGDFQSRLTSFCVKPSHFEYACWQQTANHLGSSSFITNTTGYASQPPIAIGVQYLPFGEPKRLLAQSSRIPLKNISADEQTFVDQQNGYDSRYTFSAKEKDDETQYSYFGARYYDSDLSVWLSVDPMAYKYPSLSPYCYVGNMPIIAYDPDGQKIVIVFRDENNKKQRMEYTPGMVYTGSNGFVEKAVLSLNSKRAIDSKNLNVIGSLSDIQQKIKIKEGSKNKYTPLTRTVRWNPSSAMIVFDYFSDDVTGAQTPASGLLHELGHSFFKFILSRMERHQHQLEFEADWDNRDRWSNSQDMFIIPNIENICLDPFEASRNTHYSFGNYTTVGPNTLLRKVNISAQSAIDRVSEKIENIAL